VAATGFRRNLLPNGQYLLPGGEWNPIARGNRRRAKDLERTQIMFAKPHWFRVRSFERSVKPVCWQGWLYLSGAFAIAMLPTLLLLGRHQGLEALVWLAVVGSFLFYELWQVRRNLLGYTRTPTTGSETVVATPVQEREPAADDGIYFLDRQNTGGPVNTARFQLSLKQ